MRIYVLGLYMYISIQDNLLPYRAFFPFLCSLVPSRSTFDDQSKSFLTVEEKGNTEHKICESRQHKLEVNEKHVLKCLQSINFYNALLNLDIKY